MNERSLLIIEDDEMMRELISESLSEDFGQINMTSSISEAKDLLLNNTYDCICIDIGLSDGNGAEIVKYINDWDPAQNKDTPKVVISGFINDTFKEKFSETFEGILAKPFKPGDLQAIVLIALGKRKKKKKFRGLELEKEPEVKKSSEQPEVKNKKQKRAKPAMDLKLEFDDEEIDLKIFNPTIDSPFKVENIEKRVAKTLSRVQKDKKLKDLFRSIVVDPNDKYMMAHIGLLINISTGISTKLDWGSDQTLEKFVFASYLHDLTLGSSTELARIDDLLELESEELDLSEDEKKLVKFHPSASKKLIEHKAGIPADVLTMIEQHHEMPNGSGFPRGLDHKRITPLASVFIFSQWLTDFIIKNPNWTVNKFKDKYKSKIKGPHFRKAFRALDELR